MSTPEPPEAGRRDGRRRTRRPELRWGFDDVEGDLDPATRTALAHETAAVIVRAGRQADAETARFVELSEDVGIEALAELWRDSGPDTLPGTLWALYLLRTWVRRDGEETARLYQLGRARAEVSDVVAGVAEPPGPQEVAGAADAILTSVFDGDLAVALERAAAFARVVSVGRLVAADDADEAADGEQAARMTTLAAGNVRLADQLTVAARLWRAGVLV